MPIYDLIDTNTGEVFEKTIRLSEYDQYFNDNPHIKRYHTSIHFQDSISLGLRKPTTEFRELLGRMKKNIPRNNITSRWDLPK